MAGPRLTRRHPRDPNLSPRNCDLFSSWTSFASSTVRTRLFHHRSHLRGLCNFNLAVYPKPTDRSTRTCKISPFFSSTFLERSQTIFPSDSVLRILRFCLHLRFTRNFKMYRRDECLLFMSRGIVESNFEIIDIDIDIQAEKTRNKQSGKTRRAEREEQRPFKPWKVHLWLHRKSQVAAIFYHGILVFTNGPRPRILHSWYRYRPPRA